MKNTKFAAAAIVALSICAGSAHAVTTDWKMNAFTFVDGAVATGGFTWDGDANQITDFSIDVTDGSNEQFDALSYKSGVDTAESRVLSGLGFLRFSSSTDFLGEPRPTDSRNFQIGLSSLDDLDTPVAQLFLIGAPFAPEGFIECYGCSPVHFGDNEGLRTAYFSAVPPSAVPLPAAAPLIGAAFALLGFVGSRRRRADV
jgi:hypothetical protein